MSTKEMIYQLINDFSEEQLKDILTMLKSLKNIVEDAEDEAYCVKLYNEYKKCNENNELITDTKDMIVSEYTVPDNNLTEGE